MDKTLKINRLPLWQRHPPPWPRTLLWRSFVLIALLMAISLLAWFALFTHFEEPLRARQSAQLVVSVANLTRSALLAADDSRRLGLLRALNSLEGIRLYPAEDTDRLQKLSDSTLTRTITAEVRRQLGGYTRFASELNGQSGFYVSLRLDDNVPDDEYWVMLPSDRIARSHTAEWLGWAVVALILSLLGAYMIVFRITHPLKALTQAARQIGRGEPPSPLSEAGPQELAAVAQAFNQMSHDLGQLESDRALILAGISHDLRTPLARLRLGIELAGATQEDVEAMGTDIEEMDRIIAQFLDFARTEHQEQPTRFDLVSTILQPLQEAYQRRNLSLQWQNPPELIISARAEPLRRAITNLIDNALRYAGQETVIEIHAWNEKAFAIIEVLDRGPGIPPSEVARLKRPFTRQESARSNANGSGLGLAIVERIARTHGGKLELLPREGGGLRAQIWIAIHLQAAA